MSLIINQDAVDTFEADGLSTSDIVSYFSKVVAYCDQIQTIEENDYSSYTDPSMPDDLPDAAKTDWTEEYQLAVQCNAASNVAKYNLKIFTITYKLFSMTASTPDSRQYVVDQLTYTLTVYKNETCLEFLKDIQS